MASMPSTHIRTRHIRDDGRIESGRTPRVARVMHLPETAPDAARPVRRLQAGSWTVTL